MGSAGDADLNGKIAALLRDFAAIQKSKQKMWGYKRAAAAVLALEEPIESLLLADGTLRKIPNVGPSSTRIILEVLKTGTSATIEEAIAGSGQKAEIERRRDLRGHYLSRAQVTSALRNRRLNGPTRKAYRGDLQMHSTYSDGSQTLADIVEGGLARGYSFCAVTDHSYGLPIARGVSMMRLADQQEILMGIADVIMDTYAMETAILRARKLVAAQGEAAAERYLDMTRVFCNDAVERIEARAKNTLAGMSEGDELRTLLAALRRFTKLQPMNTIAARRRIADELIAANRYVF